MSDSVTPWTPSPASLLSSLSHSPLCSLLPQPSPHFVWGWGVCMFFPVSKAVTQHRACRESVPFSRSVVSDSLRPHGRQHAGLPVHQQLSELAQTHVPRGGDAVRPSHPLSSASPPAFSLSQCQGLCHGVTSLWTACRQACRIRPQPAGRERFRAAGVWSSGMGLPVTAVFYNVLKAIKLRV